MTYFTVPQIEYNIQPNNLKLSIINKNDNDKDKHDKDKHDKENDTLINPSLKIYLNKIKNLIEHNLSNWDTIKKYTNPYEFIHTNIPGQRISISKIKPISRAFFKLIEIYNNHNICINSKPIKTFHLAEGPGGFIEATTYIRNNINDDYHGMTLINRNNSNIPGWNKTDMLLKKFPNIHIEYGKDNTGNLYNHINLQYCKDKYKNSMDIITGDGGFDFSIDFSQQEKMAFRLIFTQVAYAITMQKYNGHFILKIFDIFDKASVDIIYLLSCFYETIIISKPNTSRYANSEKYIICKHFKFINTENISNKLINILKILEKIDFNEYYIDSILNIPIQYYYLNSIKEINAILGQQQINNILTTIKLINYKDRKNDTLQNLKNNNIQKCIRWCEKNSIKYNTNFENINIFLGERSKKNSI
ncbi:MAG: hypothetical protein CL678_05560 [Bdellovibrionaceae bacterium]|nr:hypothetical protein [Pseudobdellovibrionaceae bacterium]|tara:strand:- start:481 stop:1731 length:1251 start_codon:yes stop_codon:yes gene_type:complete